MKQFTQENYPIYAAGVYRKKPVTIHAIQVDEEFEIETLEGTMRGKSGDWLIRGVEGEVYACADRVFAITYEEVARYSDIPIIWETPEDFSIQPGIPDFQFLINDTDMHEVAKLYIKDGLLCFEGDMDKAAESFFNLLKPMVEVYIESELKRRSE